MHTKKIGGKKNFLLGILIGVIILLDGWRQVYFVSCMISDNSSTILTIFCETIGKKGVLKISDSEYCSSYMCKISVDEKFCQSIIVNATDIKNKDEFDNAVNSLMLTFEHNVLVIVDNIKQCITFSTFTHGAEVKTNVISNFTKEICFFDFNREPIVQNLSEIFLSIPLQEFINYNKSGNLLIELPNQSDDVIKWINMLDNEKKLKNMTELNTITNNLILEYKSSLGTKEEIRFLKYDSKNKFIKYNTFNSIIIKDAIKTIAKK